MNYNMDEEWLEESLEVLFDLFDEEDLEELDIIDSADDCLALSAAITYSELVYKFVERNMIDIPVNIVTTTKSRKSILSKDLVSRYKGCPILHIQKAYEEDRDFGVSTHMELWLLEDGRFAEITCVQFETDDYVTLHREFKRIVKRKEHLFFQLYHLEEALDTMEMELFLERLKKAGMNKGKEK